MTPDSAPRGKASKPPIFGGAGDAPNSLFGEILDWMLAPLLLLWPISIVATNLVANDIADEPYDQALIDNVNALSRLVQVIDGRVVAILPRQARTLLHTDERDEVYFQIKDASGRLLAGDELPPPPADETAPGGKVRLFDARVGGEVIRVAALQQSPGQDAPPVLIQVAETRKKREALTSRIISGVLLPQFAIIPLAVLLVWLGLSRGLRPLRRLRQRMAERRPGDLSPISIRRVPEELQPMVRSFNETMARLEENLHAQQRFIADAAHQMKTPVTGLRTQAELALRETDPEQLRRSIAQIARAAERAGHLITQLLMLARAESSHDKLHRFEIINLKTLARDVVLEWVDRARAKQIDIGLETDDWPLIIEGAPLLLRELLMNLLDNALKYTPVGGRVTVRLIADARAVVAVEDNGIGVAESERERIFERFYRVLGTGADGSGLGLAICREIADLHRAAIRMEPSPEGPGCRAVVAFPYAEIAQT